MDMAAAAAGTTRGAPCLLSKNAFLLQSSNAAATTARFTRRASGNRGVLLGVPPRSGRRDEWDAEAGDGRLVDEDMATLRRRIREATARELPGSEDEEENDGGADSDGLGLPAEWTALERRHHGSYVAGVRGAVGLLQALLMRTRPGLGAGVVALLLLGLPASVLLLSAQLIQAVDSISSAVLNGR